MLIDDLAVAGTARRRYRGAAREPGDASPSKRNSNAPSISMRSSRASSQPGGLATRQCRRCIAPPPPRRFPGAMKRSDEVHYRVPHAHIGEAHNDATKSLNLPVIGDSPIPGAMIDEPATGDASAMFKIISAKIMKAGGFVGATGMTLNGASGGAIAALMLTRRRICSAVINVLLLSEATRRTMAYQRRQLAC